MKRTDTKVKKSMKAKVRKWIWIFLSVLLVFNVMAQTIYTMLLPSVQVETVKEGELESKLFASGAIGREDNDIISIKANRSGVVKTINYQSGDTVNDVRPVVILTAELSEQEEKAQALKGAELTSGKEGLERKIVLSKQKEADISSKIVEEKAQGIEKDTALLELEEKLRQAEQTFNLNEGLYKEAIIPKKTYEDSESELKYLQEKYNLLKEQKQKSYEEKLSQLEDELKAAKAETNDLKEQIKLYDIKIDLNEEETASGEIEVCSPKRGKVAGVQVYEGEWVNEGETLFKVIPYSKVWTLTFEVPAAQAGYIEVPQEVEWSVDRVMHTTKVTGKMNSDTKGYVVISCNLEEEEINQLGRVEGDAESGVNKAFYISADVQITSNSGTYPTTVPNSALVQEHGMYYVYVLQTKEGTFNTTYTAKKVQVMVVKQGDYQSAVQGDLYVEDQVIKNTTKALEDGIEVLLE